MNDNEPQIIYENETQNVVLRYQLNRTEIDCLYFCPHFQEAFKKKIVALQMQLQQKVMS